MAHILIVEDDKVLNHAFKVVLEEAGHKVDSAYDGKDALEQTAKKDPNLILLDLRMPVMSGLEFLKKYDLKKHKTVKVLVFSNLDAKSDIDEAYELGAHRYIVKAWSSPRQLIQLVNDTLAKK